GMRQISSIVLTVIASAAVQTGMSMSSQAQVPASPEQRWTLVRFETETGAVPLAEATEITAEFTGDGVSGNGGCNRYTGSVTVDGNSLTTGPIAATRRACPPPVSDQEFRYFEALGASERYSFSPDGELLIEYRTDNGSGTLVYTPQAVRALW
ncbi:MAG: META domain-containing protein, partial [Elainellaceae cyanobacterium]